MGIKVVIKTSVPAKVEEAKPASNVVVVPSNKPKPKSKDMAEDISEADIAALMKKMQETAAKLSQKKGITVSADVDKVSKDTSWANFICEWSKAKGYTCEVDEGGLRVDIVPDKKDIRWRLTMIRVMGTRFRVGLYFDHDSPGYSRSIEVENLYKDDALQGLDYMLKGMSIFKYKGA